MHWAYAAIDEIKVMRISHRNYERALSETFAALVASAPGEVVCLTGPSRVGKSRLADDLSRLIVGNHSPLSNGLMPVVTVLASNCTNRGIFRTKDFAVHCLEAIQQPIYGVTRPDDPWDMARFRLLDNTAESTLSGAFIKALKIRGTIYLFIDEAQHVRYALGGDLEAAAILDSWKSFAAKAKVVLVVIGAYPLIDVLRECPHLLGRKHQIHFPRYGMTEEDLLVFDQILDAYSKVIRLPAGVLSLRDWNDLLHLDSLGCIGLLEGWLRGALAAAHAQNAEFLTKDHLLASRKTLGDLRVIAAEIAAGEEALKPRGDGQDEPPPAPNAPASTNRRHHKPFRRNPRRYRFGGRA